MWNVLRSSVLCLVGGILSITASVCAQQLAPGSGWLVQRGSYPSHLWKTPVRVLLAGDSLMESLGPQMRSSLSGYSNITFIPIGKKSTGLCRPDYYNWPSVLKQNLATHRPHLVVMWVGTNDAQGIYGHTGLGETGSEAWQRVYREKVREIITLSHSYGARIMIMGPPVVGKTELNAKLGMIDRLMQTECRAAGVCYISTRYILGGSQGIFHSQGRLVSGEMVSLRTSDRVHITEGGNRRVMDYTLPYLGREIERCFRRSSVSRSAASGASGSAAVIRASSAPVQGAAGRKRR